MMSSRELFYFFFVDDRGFFFFSFSFSALSAAACVWTAPAHTTSQDRCPWEQGLHSTAVASVNPLAGEASQPAPGLSIGRYV
jgi:hypothetical protein